MRAVLRKQNQKMWQKPSALRLGFQEKGEYLLIHQNIWVQKVGSGH